MDLRLVINRECADDRVHYLLLHVCCSTDRDDVACQTSRCDHHR